MIHIVHSELASVTGERIYIQGDEFLDRAYRCNFLCTVRVSRSKYCTQVVKYST